MNQTSRTRQVGGRHYKDLKIQPTEFGMANGWDCAAWSIVKHLTRHRDIDRGRHVDLEKVIHYVELRLEMWGPWLYPRRRVCNRIPMSRYIDENGIPPAEADILLRLETWVDSSADATGHAQDIIRAIRRLMADAYGLTGEAPS
jgi:hypothetical protein